MKPLTPYLMFNGNCREAMEFYKHCFGGELNVMTYGDAPEDACPGGTQPTEETKVKVMHACLSSGEMVLMASDDPMGAPQMGDYVQLSINCESSEQVENLFNALSENGNAIMPPTETFWARKFGMLIDQYGFRWMLNFPAEQ